MTTTTEAAKRTGATYRQIDYWFRCGWLGVDNAKGNGSRRWLTREQVQRIQVLHAASAAGIDVSRVAYKLALTKYEPSGDRLTLALDGNVTVTIRIDPIR